MYACAVLPDHVHLVVSRPNILVERLVIQLKGEATQRLVKEGIHPLDGLQKPGSRVPKCWARGEWKVFLDPEDVRRAIEYVKENPVKEGKPVQKWSFVVPYPG